MKKCGWCSRRHPDDAITCLCNTPYPFGPASRAVMILAAQLGGYTPGNDISTWQESPQIPGDIDFDRMAARSAFVFIKRSQSKRPDADGARNYRRARGKLRRGAYVYLDWSMPLVDQVDYFFSTFERVDGLGELPIVLDFEEWENAPAPGSARAQLREAIERAEYHMAQWGMSKRVILYTSPGYWAVFGSRDVWWAEHCDLWIAHYYVVHPSIPLPWVDWRFWQYSDKGNGPLHGVESLQIDMDHFNGDLVEFVRYALPLPGSEPPPPPEGSEIMQKYQVIGTDGLNLRVAPRKSAESKAVWPYLGELTGTGQVSEGLGGIECWVQVLHPVFGPLWAAFVYNGKRYLNAL